MIDTVKLFDTLSREVKPFEIREGRRFGMYVCGPTVYGPAHIGNFLTFLRFDVLYRVLREAGYNPYFVRNITDVDDKTIKQSRLEGVELGEFTEKWTKFFHEDCDRLNLLTPDCEPRATDHIPEQIDLITKLLEKDYAYIGSDGSVYFRVTAFKDYGKLSHFDPSELMTQSENSAGSVNQADEYDRESVSDFALWKAVKEEDGDNYWESPWGRGRPGWHIECSAMSLKYLGTDFDMHGGGEDLCFPHHENEIAQSEGATGEPFARHWVHMVHLLVEGKKMSKSLGNFYILKDLLEKGWTVEEIRMALLGGHYRQQYNFTESGLEAARSALKKLSRAVESLCLKANVSLKTFEEMSGTSLERRNWGTFKRSWDALCHDLNTPACLGSMHSSLRKAEKAAQDAGEAYSALEGLAGIFYVLGIKLPPKEETKKVDVPEDVQALAEERWLAKKNKDFSQADSIRAQLLDLGFVVTDGKDGYSIELKGS